MSYAKNDQLFHNETPASAAQKIALSISQALRQDYSELTSAVKRIGRITGAHPRAIRNWYEGRNVPNSTHLMMLAQCSPNVLRVLLELIGRGDLAEFISRDFFPTSKPLQGANISNPAKNYGERFFTINVITTREIAAKLNQRQLWFLGLLQAGREAKPSDIVSAWGVTLRSAKSDLARLRKLRLIRFIGARRNGCYILSIPSGLPY